MCLELQRCLCLGKQWCYLWIYTLNNHPDMRESSQVERQLKGKLMWAPPPFWGPDIHLWDWLNWCPFSGERYCHQRLMPKWERRLLGKGREQGRDWVRPLGSAHPRKRASVKPIARRKHPFQFWSGWSTTLWLAELVLSLWVETPPQGLQVRYPTHQMFTYNS